MAISFVGAASGVDTATLPAHQAGDVLLVFAYNDAAATIPSIASGFSTILAPAAGNSNGHRLAYRIATSAAEALGTWANATQILALVYRGCDPGGPIGASAFASGVADVTYPPLNLQSAPSWVVGMHGRRTGNQENVSVPAGTVLRGDTGPSGAGRVVGIDTNAPVSSWPSTPSGGSNTFRYRSVSVELKPAPAAEKRTGTLSATLAAMTSTASGRVAVRGALTRMFEPMTASSVGKAALRGRVDGRLDAMTAEGAGRLLVRGQVNAIFAPMTGEASGRLAGRGDLSASFAPMTLDAGGTSPRRGSLDAAFAPLTGMISGAAEERRSGRLAASFAPLTVEANGDLAVRGSVAAAFGAMTSDGLGRLRVAATLVATFGALTLSAIGRKLNPSRPPLARTVRLAAQMRLVQIEVKPGLFPPARKGRAMRELEWPAKDPDDTLDYAIDWTARLEGGDEISSVDWFATPPLAIERHAISGNVATVWISGGEPGRFPNPRVTCRITTAAGRRMDQSVMLPILKL